MQTFSLNIQHPVAIGANRIPNGGIFGKRPHFWRNPAGSTKTNPRGGIGAFYGFKQIPRLLCLGATLAVPSRKEVAGKCLDWPDGAGSIGTTHLTVAVKIQQPWLSR